LSEDESPPAESGKRGLRFVDSVEDDVDKEKGEEEMTGDELSTESQQVPVVEPAVEQEYVMKGRFPSIPGVCRNKA